MKPQCQGMKANAGLGIVVIAVFFFLQLSVARARQNRPEISNEANEGASSAPSNEVESGNWPRFRGPQSIPVSNHPNLPERWSTTENVEWVVEVPGVGWSSPVVWGGKVFITSATSEQSMKQPSLGTDFSNEYIAELRAQGLSSEEVNERLYTRDREMPHEIVISLMAYCHDLETGKRLWEHQIYKGHPRGGRHRKNSYASETPVTDGEHLYVYFTHHGLYAYNFEGKQIWATPLESHQTIRDFGTGASPALHRDRLFVLNDNEDQSFLAAFDKRTGRRALAQAPHNRRAQEDRLVYPVRLGERATNRSGDPRARDRHQLRSRRRRAVAHEAHGHGDYPISLCVGWAPICDLG